MTTTKTMRLVDRSLNFTNIKTSKLPRTDSHEWIDMYPTRFKLLDTLLNSETVPSPHTVVKQLTHLLTLGLNRVINILVDDCINEHEELTERHRALMTDSLKKNASVGRLVMVDSYRDPIINGLLSDWAEDRGIILIYPAPEMHTQELSIYVLKQYYCPYLYPEIATARYT